MPGHSNIAGNELADAAAKEATLLPSAQGAISYRSICAHIRQSIVDGAAHTQGKSRSRRTVSPPEKTKFFWHGFALAN